MLSAFLKTQISHIYRDCKTQDCPPVPQNATLEQLYAYIDKLPKIKPVHGKNREKIEFIKNNTSADDIVLDYGCGNARIIAELPNKCMCIERPEMYKFSEHQSKPQIKFIYETDPSKLPILDFTTITFFHALHHLENLRDVLKYVVNTKTFKQMLILDHNCTNRSGEEILYLQHYLYRHAYNETYYYTEFYSHFNMRNLLNSMGLREVYHRDLKRYDYSYLAKYVKSESKNALLPTSQNRDGLRMTEEGIYSYTKAHDFDKTIFTNNNNRLIIDCTANIGGDTIHFSKIYKEVLAFEYNDVNFQALTENTKDIPNITIKHGNCIELLDKYLHNINTDTDALLPDLYFDPPWGGPDYKKERTVCTYVYGYSPSQLITKYSKHRIIFKLPKNHQPITNSSTKVTKQHFVYVIADPK